MTHSPTGSPAASEYAPHFQRYIDYTTGVDDIFEALGSQVAELRALVGDLDDAAAGRRYAEGKWSVRELVGHVTDSERVFGYRALCVARGETESLPGFDENVYAAHSDADLRQLSDILDEFGELRSSTVRMLRSLQPEAWTRAGVANGKPVTARALAFVMLGHVRHHLGILRERYLQAT